MCYAVQYYAVQFGITTRSVPFGFYIAAITVVTLENKIKRERKRTRNALMLFFLVLVGNNKINRAYQIATE